MVHNDVLVASSFHKRPDSRILTYREIASSPEASLTQPSNSDFACLDHVLLPMTSLHNLKAASTQPTWTLPWFHRRYPLSFTITFDKFVKPPKKPPPKITPPRTKADQLKFQRKFADTFATLTGSTSYTLGSHPNPLAASVLQTGLALTSTTFRWATPLVGASPSSSLHTGLTLGDLLVKTYPRPYRAPITPRNYRLFLELSTTSPDINNHMESKALTSTPTPNLPMIFCMGYLFRNNTFISYANWPSN